MVLNLRNFLVSLFFSTINTRLIVLSPPVSLRTILRTVQFNIQYLTSESTRNDPTCEELLPTEISAQTRTSMINHKLFPIVANRLSSCLSEYSNLYPGCGEIEKFGEIFAHGQSRSDGTSPAVKSKSSSLCCVIDHHGPIQIFIRTLRDTTICLEMSPASTINDLKQVVYASEGIPPSHQRLLSGIREYSAESILSDLCEAGATVTILVSFLGGNPEDNPRIMPVVWWFGFGRNFQDGRVGDGLVRHVLGQIEFHARPPLDWYSDQHLSEWSGVVLFGPTGSNAKGIHRLDLANFKIKSLPESIGYLAALCILDVGRNYLMFLPENIGNLSSLTYLWLSHNQLTSLPDSIGNLSSLKQLNITGNKLTALPDSIGNLTSLVWLFAAQNLLTTLPEAIRNLSALASLFIMVNPITSTNEGMEEVHRRFGRPGLAISMSSNEL